MKSAPIIRIRDHMPALEKFGVAVHYFLDYVNPEPMPHGVDTLLLSFIASGSGHHWMNDAVYPVSPGSLGITHYGEVHSIVTGPGGMDVYNIYLDPRSCPLPSMPPELNHMQQILFANREEFRHRLNRSVHLHFNDPSLPLHCLQVMHREMTNPSPGSATVVAAMLRVFLVACCRAALELGISPSLADDALPPAWLMDICRYLDENYAEPVSLEMLAKQGRVSTGYLCRIFKKEIGLGVVDYLTERRIQTATRLLQETDDKILSIAMEAGFGDLSHFNRVFKKLTGLSPSAYRKQHRAG